jgi:hypothetical protein
VVSPFDPSAPFDAYLVPGATCLSPVPAFQPAYTVAALGRLRLTRDVREFLF